MGGSEAGIESDITDGAKSYGCMSACLPFIVLSLLNKMFPGSPFTLPDTSSRPCTPVWDTSTPGGINQAAHAIYTWSLPTHAFHTNVINKSVTARCGIAPCEYVIWLAPSPTADLSSLPLKHATGAHGLSMS